MTEVLLSDGFHPVVPGTFEIIEIATPAISVSQIFWGAVVHFQEDLGGGVIVEVFAWIGQVHAVRLGP